MKIWTQQRHILSSRNFLYVNNILCTRVVSLSHLAGIRAPVRAPSTKHIFSDLISVVRFCLADRLRDEVHICLLQVLRVTLQYCKHKILAWNSDPPWISLSAVSAILTFTLVAKPSNAALESNRKVSVDRREAHHAGGRWLCSAFPVQASDPQQCWISKGKHSSESLIKPQSSRSGFFNRCAHLSSFFWPKKSSKVEWLCCKRTVRLFSFQDMSFESK